MIDTMHLIAVSRGIRRPLERQVKSKGGGIWRTTDDGNRIFIDGAGEVRAGGPAGPILKEATKRKPRKAPAKPQQPRVVKKTEAKPRPKPEPDKKPARAPKPGQDAGQEPKLNEAGEKVKKKRQSREPKQKIDDVISEYIDSKDKKMIAAFKTYVDEAHAMLGEKRNSDRYALQEVLGQFGYKGSKASGWVGALRFKDDYTEIQGFDEMAEYAAKAYPELLSFDSGESSGEGDVEQAFFRRLQEGFPYAPGKDSEEVLDRAAQMAGPSFFADATVADYEEKASGEMDTWDKEELAELEDSPF